MIMLIYKVQEYFSYNQNSFYDLECDLDKHRLEQFSPILRTNSMCGYVYVDNYVMYMNVYKLCVIL